MQKYFYSVILSLGFVFLSISSALASTYYVSTNGSDSYNGLYDTYQGSSNGPWKTMQYAIDNNSVKAGDTITVLAGDYANQRVKINKSGSVGLPITFLALGTVKMKGFAILANYITIDGFEIADTDYSHNWDYSQQGIFIQGAYNLIQNNYIHDAAMRGLFLYSPSGNPAYTHDNIIKNNKLYHNQQAGIEVRGRNNIIESNEIWDTVQCHPTVMAFEEKDAANSGLKCNRYNTIDYLDADGIDFFGSGHTFRNNNIHDIPFGPLGINPAVGDYNDNPHIDCFQTWSDGTTDHEAGSNITFEGNRCDNAQMNGNTASAETGTTFMLAGGSNNLIIKNNIFKSYTGINTSGTGNADYLYIYNNLWINNPSIQIQYPKVAQFDNSPHIVMRNNIFYEQPKYTVIFNGDTTKSDISYNLAYNTDLTNPPHCIQWGDWNTCLDNTTNHNIWNINPQFIDPINKNYQLKTGSPAIDTGITIAGVNKDFEGITRPQGYAFDIGPFEYNSGGNLTPTISLTPTSIPKLGDTNNDTRVDGADYSTWSNNYSKPLTGKTYGDFNNDGFVSGIDYTIWFNNYGK